MTAWASTSWSCRSRDGEAGKFVKSPITGELVAVDQMAEHMRISLIDPRWRTQREAMLAKIRETTKASDDEIGRNLVGLARHRPDVFGEVPRSHSHLGLPHVVKACGSWGGRRDSLMGRVPDHALGHVPAALHHAGRQLSMHGLWAAAGGQG